MFSDKLNFDGVLMDKLGFVVHDRLAEMVSEPSDRYHRATRSR